MSTATVTATSTARDVASRRVRKALFPLGILALILLLAWASSLLLPTGDTEDFGPSNPRPTGARALAQVLKDNGVNVSYTQALPTALRSAKPGTTVLIYTTSFTFEASQIQTLRETGADLVLLSPSPGMLEAADMGLSHGSYIPLAAPISAQCDVPGPVAAQEIQPTGVGFVPSGNPPGDPPGDLELCFTADGSSHFAQLTVGTQTVTAVSDADAWSNRRVIEDGNAALALHTLGKYDSLIWFHPKDVPFVLEDQAPPFPPRFAMAAAVILIAAAFLIFAAYRRFGPVVAEQLPVVVKSSETTLGRGRLYRSAQAHGRAAAALRAATATRLAHRLGVPNSGDRQSLIGAVSGATNHDPSYLEALFYGPAPTNDGELVVLGSRLSALESEITQ